MGWPPFCPQRHGGAGPDPGCLDGVCANVNTFLEVRGQRVGVRSPLTLCGPRDGTQAGRCGGERFIKRIRLAALLLCISPWLPIVPGWMGIPLLYQSMGQGDPIPLCHPSPSCSPELTLLWKVFQTFSSFPNLCLFVIFMPAHPQRTTGIQ